MKLKIGDIVYLSLDGRERDMRYVVTLTFREKVWLRDSSGVVFRCDPAALRVTRIESAPLTPFTPQPRMKGRNS